MGRAIETTTLLLNTFSKKLKRLYVTYCGESCHGSQVIPGLSKDLNEGKRHLPNLEALALEGQFNFHSEVLENAKDNVRCVKS